MVQSMTLRRETKCESAIAPMRWPRKWIKSRTPRISWCMRADLHSRLVRAALLILTLAPSAFGLAAEVARPTAGRHAKVEAAWIRWLPANVPFAGYASITNLADRAIVLT